MATLDGFRGRINQHQIIALLLLAAIVALAIVLVNRSWAPRGSARPVPTEEAYYDEKSAQIVKLPAGQVPPVSRDGVELVRAYVVPGTTDILYLEKYTDGAKAQVEAMMPESMSLPERLAVLKTKHPGCMVRSPVAGSPWFAADTPEARNLLTR